MFINIILFIGLLGYVGFNTYRQNKVNKLLESFKNIKDPDITTQIATDSQGRKISEMVYYSDTDYLTEYKRDESGRLVCILTTITNIITGNSTTTGDFYDASGNKTRENVPLKRTRVTL